MSFVLLLADNDARRGEEVRQFFSESGLRVLWASNDLECLGARQAIRIDVLVTWLEMPCGSDGVIARLNYGLFGRRKPVVFVMGESPAQALSARTGAPPCNCFSVPVRNETLRDRIIMKFLGHCGAQHTSHGHRKSELRKAS